MNIFIYIELDLYAWSDIVSDFWSLQKGWMSIYYITVKEKKYKKKLSCLKPLKEKLVTAGYFYKIPKKKTLGIIFAAAVKFNIFKCTYYVYTLKRWYSNKK